MGFSSTQKTSSNSTGSGTQAGSTQSNLWPQIAPFLANYQTQFSGPSINTVNPGVNQFQTGAATNQAALTNLGTAAGIAASGLTPGAIQAQFSPYVQSVVNPTLAAQQIQNEQAVSNLRGSQAKNNAFGNNTGAEAAYYAGVQPSQQAQIGSLYNQGYQQAQNTALNSLGTQLGALTAGTTANAGLGNLGANIWQSALTGAMTPFNLYNTGVQGLGGLANIAGQNYQGNWNQQQQGTSTTTGTPGGIIPGLIGGVLSAFADGGSVSSLGKAPMREDFTDKVRKAFHTVHELHQAKAAKHRDMGGGTGGELAGAMTSDPTLGLFLQNLGKGIGLGNQNIMGTGNNQNNQQNQQQGQAGFNQAWKLGEGLGNAFSGLFGGFDDGGVVDGGDELSNDGGSGLSGLGSALSGLSQQTQTTSGSSADSGSGLGSARGAVELARTLQMLMDRDKQSLAYLGYSGNGSTSTNNTAAPTQGLAEGGVPDDPAAIFRQPTGGGYQWPEGPMLPQGDIPIVRSRTGGWSGSTASMAPTTTGTIGSDFPLNPLSVGSSPWVQHGLASDPELRSGSGSGEPSDAAISALGLRALPRETFNELDAPQMRSALRDRATPAYHLGLGAPNATVAEMYHAENPESEAPARRAPAVSASGPQTAPPSSVTPSGPQSWFGNLFGTPDRNLWTNGRASPLQWMGLSLMAASPFRGALQLLPHMQQNALATQAQPSQIALREAETQAQRTLANREGQLELDLKLAREKQKMDLENLQTRYNMLQRLLEQQQGGQGGAGTGRRSEYRVAPSEPPPVNTAPPTGPQPYSFSDRSPTGERLGSSAQSPLPEERAGEATLGQFYIRGGIVYKREQNGDRAVSSVHQRTP